MNLTKTTKNILLSTTALAVVCVFLAGLVQKYPAPQMRGVFDAGNNIKYASEARLLESNKSVLIIPAEGTTPKLYTLLTSRLAQRGYSSIVFQRPVSNDELDYWLFAKRAFDLTRQQSDQYAEEQSFAAVIAFGKDGKEAILSILEREDKPDAIITTHEVESGSVRSLRINPQPFAGLSPAVTREITSFLEETPVKHDLHSFLYITLLVLAFGFFITTLFLVLIFSSNMNPEAQEFFPVIKKRGLNIAWNSGAVIIATILAALFSYSFTNFLVIFAGTTFLLLFTTNIILDKKFPTRNILIFIRGKDDKDYSAIISIVSCFFIILIARLAFFQIPKVNKELLSLIMLAPTMTITIFVINRHSLTLPKMLRGIVTALPYIAILVASLIFQAKKGQLFENSLICSGIILIFYLNNLIQLYSSKKMLLNNFIATTLFIFLSLQVWV
ncbi:MAG: hypothetical protein JXR63_09250 [Spirochaetales bacterium]|nr:hypothetical protein [Spirochaetales bacterium]